MRIHTRENPFSYNKYEKFSQKDNLTVGARGETGEKSCNEWGDKPSGRRNPQHSAKLAIEIMYGALHLKTYWWNKGSKQSVDFLEVFSSAFFYMVTLLPTSNSNDDNDVCSFSITKVGMDLTQPTSYTAAILRACNQEIVYCRSYVQCHCKRK